MSIEAVRAEALEKLGRNIINFSKIEGALKYLLAIKEFEITNGKIQKNYDSNKGRLKLKTLGQLVQEFQRTVIISNESEITSPDTKPESDFSIQFKLSYDSPKSLESQRQRLSKIVAERNHLIHQYLAPLDTTCIDDYQKLIGLLDKQHPKLLSQLEGLGKIIEEVQNGYKEIRNLLKHSDYLKQN